MQKTKNPLMKTERLMAFCDGVFAIAVTILVLEIKVPEHNSISGPDGLYNHLWHLWPSYLSYAMSFLVIGIYWSNHNWLFSFIHRTNHTMNMLHIWFLMAVSFMPFTTAVLGDYVLSFEYRNAAITACCLGYLLPVPPTLILYNYATKNRRLTLPNLNQKFIDRQKYKLISGLLSAILAFAFSFTYPIVSMVIIGFSLLTFLLPPETPVFDEVND